MSKSKETPDKKKSNSGRKNTLTATPCTPLPIKVFKVGVYLPERDPIDFVITCHDFQLKGDKADTVFFYTITESGFKEFIATFKHVVYIVLTEERLVVPSGSVDLPEGFGKLS